MPEELEGEQSPNTLAAAEGQTAIEAKNNVENELEAMPEELEGERSPNTLAAEEDDIAPKLSEREGGTSTGTEEQSDSD
eukprot:9257213-Alexandrium_andersonii.AAC.1